MKNLLFKLFILCFSTFLCAFLVDSGSELTGIWKFNLPEVPEGYNEGHIEFAQKQSGLEGKFVTDNGTFPMQRLVVSNDSVTCDLTIQSAHLQAILVKSKDTLSGKILTPEGDLPIIAIRSR